MPKIGIFGVKKMGDVITGGGMENPHEAAWVVMFQTKVSRVNYFVYVKSIFANIPFSELEFLKF